MSPRRLTNSRLLGLCSCGQVGHLAENCSSTERLCFNCGKGGHESSACPDPRTAEQKSCYLCLGKGHIKVSLSGAACTFPCPLLTYRPASVSCRLTALT